MTIRKLLATTAIATIATMGGHAAFAQQAEQPAAGAEMTIEYAETQDETAHLASDLIGKEVQNSAGDDAETIGEIEDLVLAEDGTVDFVIIGVGGFLDLGEKHVAVNYESLTWSDGPDGATFLVVETTKEELEAAPSYEYAAMQPDSETSMTADKATDAETDREQMASEDSSATQEPMAEGQAMTETDPMAEGDQPAPEGEQQLAEGEPMAEGQPDGTVGNRVEFGAMEQAAPEAITADNLLDRTVYGADDENIGEIGDIVLTKDGQIDAVILDVGGFLGIGEKPVAIGFDALEILSNRDGRLVVRTAFTQEELDAAPEYVEEDYESSRESMRLTMVRPAE